jgi:hypothetical protein
MKTTNKSRKKIKIKKATIIKIFSKKKYFMNSKKY